MTTEEMLNHLDDLYVFGHKPTEKDRKALEMAIDMLQTLERKHEELVSKMSRYIDADKLIKDMNDYCEGNCKQCINSTFLSSNEHCGLIDQQPIADVQPVKHGEWKIKVDEVENEVEMWCSNCRRLHLFETLESAERYAANWLYCPDCGAVMDLKPLKGCKNVHNTESLKKGDQE
ncbi:hypothetical protein AALA24_13535 [Anaerovoracaceae bacterium 42-11]